MTNLRWAREEQLKQVKVTAHPPYGYDRNSETYTWCVNPQKARRVKKLRVRRPVQQKLRLHFAGRWKRLDIMPGSTAPPILDSATAWMIRSSRHSPIGIWQYSSSGQVNGISGRVDMDVSYQDFPSIIKAGGYNGYAKANGSQPGSPAPAPAPARKSVDELAREVLAGKWGNGTDRKSRIASAGYDYTVVQAKVNELLHAQSRPQAVYYTVQRGDTLSAIARKYGTSVATIQRLNPSLIRNVNRIQVGWKIRVK